MISEVRALVGRPALIGFLSCASGIALARLANTHGRLEIVMATLLLVIAGISAYFLSFRSRLLSNIVGTFAAFIFGFLLLSYREYRFENSVISKMAEIYSGESVIYGKVISSPDQSVSSISFFLETDSLLVDSLSIHAHEKISVTISGREKADERFLPQLGQRVKLFADLEHIEHAKNPYEISYDIHLKEKEDITARAYLRSPFDLYSIDSIPHLSRIQKVEQFFQGLFAHAKATVSSSTGDSLTSGFVNAVVLGDKSGLSSETLDDFQRAGLTHLLVVSGFNVSIVALLAFYLLRLLGISFRKVRIALAMLCVLFYCLLVGMEPSVVRAFIVIEFLFIGRLFERKPDIGNLTAGAALVTIALHPYDLFDIGFQLSYGAVFSLVFFYPPLERLLISEKVREGKTALWKIVYRSLQGMLGSLSVFIGLLPVFLFHFHRVSIVGLGINILGIPLAAVITVFGFLLLPMSVLGSWIASIYGESLLWMTKLIAWLAHFSGSFQWSVIQLPRPQTIFIAFYIVLLFYITRAPLRRNFFARVVLVGSFVCMVFSARIQFAYSLVRSNDKVSLLFLDVGQGDAMLVATPNGKTYLVDFGGITKSNTAIAERAIEPLLKAEGITGLSGGFITHMHIDHYGGAVPILEGESCGVLYTSGERTSGYAAYRLDSISQAMHIPVIRLSQGSELTLDEDVHLFVLNPEAHNGETSLPLSSEGMNHHSLAMKVVYKNSSALLLGDIEASDEERLVGMYGGFVRSDIVKVAHHGSHTSSSESLVKTAKPKYAVISVGKHNTFGHPSIPIIKRWIRAGSSVERTDKQGAILFQSDGSEFRKIDWR
ncbi:MAG: DNA internalization-related competence protein ComEC/Rec2 [Bacteroidota bacterium]|nr:DNA internalization-related competence protein ComEC/Rec2 [Bacteroidota bacterium]MDP4234849.1 DNA internalization-related competence protein ComEC/Rec2 [Bacteroidota bacterium]